MKMKLAHSLDRTIFMCNCIKSSEK